MADAFAAWLIAGGIGPALAGIPVNLAGNAGVGAAQRLFRRLRRTDDLSRLVKASTGTAVDLTKDEFDAVRRLLESPETWQALGHGTHEDLARQIAVCLPPRAGRTTEDSYAAAVIIARGLLEFAVADVDRELFQQLLFARLQRMEIGQADALDRSLFELQADLVTGFAAVMGEFERVLDRLPPGPAHLVGVMAYLAKLIDWLNTDPWPQDERFKASSLTPAALERRLHVAAVGLGGGQGFDADELVQRCHRLVILGGPGAGKTWLAKRTARRCAEEALKALAEGSPLDLVELPLYTTCSRLLSATGDVRSAAASSALDYELGDVGGARLSAAIRVFFTERNAPTVLVIDSLDEAPGSRTRLRQADTLPWRIILTSRPSSWNHQLTIDKENDSHEVGELQPLQYPDDVDPFIRRWFGDMPEWADALVTQIARRPSLQQAATVPLILAFYCIIGGNEPLPELRRVLYAKVINRMLTGRWRGDEDAQPDGGACLQTLRSWAWSGAACDPVSGTGTWADEILVSPARLGEADDDALAHVATPLSPADVDTGMTMRRFVHRSVREHLVAEHVASLPVVDAAEILLPHLWYDPDWEYSAPTAIAMHPRHDLLLRELICRAAATDKVPADLSVIDGGGEFQGLLARVSTGSREDDWSSDAASIIGNARAGLVGLAYSYDISGITSRVQDISGTTSWRTSDRQALLGDLTRAYDGFRAAKLVDEMVQLEPSADELRQVREALLEQLAWRGGRDAHHLVRGLTQVNPSADDTRQARHKLLELLVSETDDREVGDLAGALVLLGASQEERGRVTEALLSQLAHETVGSGVSDLMDGLVHLDLSVESKRQVREALITLLIQNTGRAARELVHGLVRLDLSAEDTSRASEALLGLLANETSCQVARELAEGLALLDISIDDRHQARDALLDLLAGETDSRWAVSLVNGLNLLDPSPDDRREARDVLLDLLMSLADEATQAPPITTTDKNWKTPNLVDAFVRLDPPSEDRRVARSGLLLVLCNVLNEGLAHDLADRVVRLALSLEEKSEVREDLLDVLSNHYRPWLANVTVASLTQLDLSTEDKRQARKALLEDDSGLAWAADHWVYGLTLLEPTEEDKGRAREALLRRISGLDDSRGSPSLVDSLIRLEPSEADRRQAREALIRILANQAHKWYDDHTVEKLVQLSSAAEDKRQTREALLGFLDDPSHSQGTNDLVRGLADLATSADDKRQAREALLGLLASQNHPSKTESLVQSLVALVSSAEEKGLTRRALLQLLASQNDSSVAIHLMRGMIDLDPTAHDLSNWRNWAVRPSAELLAAARRNSALADWLEALPLLP